MIARLRGRLLEKSPSEIVVDVGGVGYHAHVSLTTFCALPETGEQVDLATVTNLRENALELFAFATAGERAMFRLLRGVSGVGPRVALSVLSGMPTEELAGVLAEGEVARLTAVPGVGKKTAERLIVELRAKAAELPGAAPAGAKPAEEDAVAALVGLGYKQAEARRAVRAAADDGATALEDVIRQSLSRLG